MIHGRRQVVSTLALATLGAPLAALAQQSTLPVIGFLHSATPAALAREVVAFRAGLAETGFVEGRNVVVEYRWAEGEYGRLPGLAADLVARRVKVIAAGAGTGPLVASIAGATPIVFITGGDPVRDGFVASFNRPGGNITGLAILTFGLQAKRFALLREAVPGVAAVAFLVNPRGNATERERREMANAASHASVRLLVLAAATAAEIEPAFAEMTRQGIGAVVVASDAFFNSRREQLVAAAAHRRLPATYEWRDFVEIGGLMSYGIVLPDVYRQVGNYVGRILRGANPGDLPVIQPTRFELVVNLRTARTLGLDLPASLLAAADEVIE